MNETVSSQMTNELSSIKPESEPLSWRFWRKRRYIVVLMAFLGFVSNYSLRVNLSVAIVAMTENRTIYIIRMELLDMCDQYDNIVCGLVLLKVFHYFQEQYFDWSSQERGLILSAFFWGYIFTQFAGGFFAKKFGGNLVFGVGIGSTSILTLLTPWIGTTVTSMIIIRVIEGFFEGVTFPCIHDVWSQWSPPHERSRMATIAYSGTYVGTVITMPACAYLANALGWQSLFYVFGAIGIVWYIAWIIVVKSSPDKDRFVSKDELDYIQSTLTVVTQSNPNVPWKSLFTSSPVYAIAASHTAENWGFYTMITQMPSFLKDTMNYDLGSSGILSAAPYLAMGIFLSFAGYAADMLQIRGILTTTQVRRYFNCGAFLIQAIFMLLAAYFLHPIWSVLCIIMGVGLGAFAWCGFSVNPLDIAPQYASIIMGYSNTFGTIPGIVSPALTGYLVKNQTAEEWRIVFYIIAAIYTFGCIIYWCWCSGELQSWAKSDKKEETRY